MRAAESTNLLGDMTVIDCKATNGTIRVRPSLWLTADCAHAILQSEQFFVSFDRDAKVTFQVSLAKRGLAGWLEGIISSLFRAARLAIGSWVAFSVLLQAVIELGHRKQFSASLALFETWNSLRGLAPRALAARSSVTWPRPVVVGLELVKRFVFATAAANFAVAEKVSRIALHRFLLGSGVMGTAVSSGACSL